VRLCTISSGVVRSCAYSHGDSRRTQSCT
jgi:hypothetical protein